LLNKFWAISFSLSTEEWVPRRSVSEVQIIIKSPSSKTPMTNGKVTFINE